jgi:hypothetical protein
MSYESNLYRDVTYQSLVYPLKVDPRQGHIVPMPSAGLALGHKGHGPRAPKIQKKRGAPEFSDLPFIQTEGPQIFKNMISFFSGPKINPT